MSANRLLTLTVLAVLSLALAGPALAARPQPSTLTLSDNSPTAGSLLTLTGQTDGPMPQIVAECSVDGTPAVTWPGIVGQLERTIQLPDYPADCEARLITTRDGDHFRAVARVAFEVAE